ncbi:hypothetical protein HAX54_021236 [Datura stramonium]|uniref:Uncharacterized protein n=1 Tax=Datura stramonium TaxID=4076 RepID=A0ABS8UTX7_DATST|nr:hypothetical protein [Datura stramonium]
MSSSRRQHKGKALASSKSKGKGKAKETQIPTNSNDTIRFFMEGMKSYFIKYQNQFVERVWHPFLDALAGYHPNLVVEFYASYQKTIALETKFSEKIATKGNQLRWMASTIAMEQPMWATIGGEIAKARLHLNPSCG